jgi:hypothetical protein
MGLVLPLGDLSAVKREFQSPDLWRLGLDRCLRRHGENNLKAMHRKASGKPR